MSLFRVLLVCGSIAFSAAVQAQTGGALGNGLSAAALARGGTEAAQQGEPLEAIEGNPAGLATITSRVLGLSAVGVLAYGSFRNVVDAHGTMSGLAGAMPYGAFGLPLGRSQWKAGFAVTPELLMRAKWHYIDPPGTAGASYGLQKNESQIVAMRSSATLARRLGRRWTAGASVGVVYNTNTLHAPYIFQQQSQLAGLKVLLQLNTRGYGWNGSAGAQWQPTSRVTMGAAWKSGTSIESHGSASGTAAAQFAALGIIADPAFHYQAEVDNHLPQSLGAGIFVRTGRHVRLGAEGGWTGWRGAFVELPVKLTHGTNATINSVAGSDAVRDGVPLHWRDQGSLRVGVDLPVAERWTVSAGYAFQTNPVPSATLTPVTAAILSQSLTTGAGWSKGKWRWDAAYQAQLPASQTVAVSSLQAGEYSNSQVRVMTQSLTITAQTTF